MQINIYLTNSKLPESLNLFSLFFSKVKTELNFKELHINTIILELKQWQTNLFVITFRKLNKLFSFSELLI